MVVIILLSIGIGLGVIGIVIAINALSIATRKLHYRQISQEDRRFIDAKPILGLEKYGRAIRGLDDSISGSPANYEHSRGSTTNPGPTPSEIVNAMRLAARKD